MRDLIKWGNLVNCEPMYEYALLVFNHMGQEQLS